MTLFAEEFSKFKGMHAGYEVCVPDSMVKRIERFVNDVIARKGSEDHHMRDGSKEFTRFYTGTLGEVALELFLKVQFVDWTVGESSAYHSPDLKSLGINAGIKTVEHGKFPIIFKTSHCPEIINIKMDRNKVLIMGVASTTVLQRCQDDALILSPALRQRGTKTGFYGLAEVQPFGDIEELRQLVSRGV